MRITFEIDANDLKEIQKITGQKKKSPAITRALADYLRMRERRAFIEKALAGQTDYALTNEELEAREESARPVGGFHLRHIVAGVASPSIARNV
jgi:hypothetical protein